MMDKLAELNAKVVKNIFGATVGVGYVVGSGSIIKGVKKLIHPRDKYEKLDGGMLVFVGTTILGVTAICSTVFFDTYRNKK